MRKIEKNLRQRLKEKDEEIERLKNDRDKFRYAFIENFKCSVKILGEGKTWNMEYVVKTLAQQLTRFEKWYW